MSAPWREGTSWGTEDIPYSRLSSRDQAIVQQNFLNEIRQRGYNYGRGGKQLKKPEVGSHIGTAARSMGIWGQAIDSFWYYYQRGKKGLPFERDNPTSKRREPEYLRDMEAPRILGGYDLDRRTLMPIRKSVDVRAPGDYGADPMGDGTFRMIPSGDIVSYEERNRRLEKRNPMGRPRRQLRNPEVKSASQMAEEFHGRAVDEVINIEELDTEPGTYAEIGKLIELTIRDERYEYVVAFNGGEHNSVLVCTDPQGRQLYFIGGNQRMDKFLAEIDTTKTINHRYTTVGFCSHIVYLTDKHHLADSNGEACEYSHHFGEQGGTYPLLVYDTLNQRIFLVGGTYEVRDVGIWN